MSAVSRDRGSLHTKHVERVRREKPMRVNQGAGFALEPIAELRIGGEPFGEYF
jgi:hypothetical protein